MDCIGCPAWNGIDCTNDPYVDGCIKDPHNDEWLRSPKNPEANFSGLEKKGMNDE